MQQQRKQGRPEVVVITGVFNYLGTGRDGRQTLSTEAHP